MLLREAGSTCSQSRVIPPCSPGMLPGDQLHAEAPPWPCPAWGQGPAEPVAHLALGERREPLRWRRNRCGKERAVAMETLPNWESGSFPGNMA